MKNKLMHMAQQRDIVATYCNIKRR